MLAFSPAAFQSMSRMSTGLRAASTPAPSPWWRPRLVPCEHAVCRRWVRQSLVHRDAPCPAPVPQGSVPSRRSFIREAWRRISLARAAFVNQDSTRSPGDFVPRCLRIGNGAIEIATDALNHEDRVLPLRGRLRCALPAGGICWSHAALAARRPTGTAIEWARCKTRWASRGTSRGRHRRPARGRLRALCGPPFDLQRRRARSDA